MPETLYYLDPIFRKDRIHVPEDRMTLEAAEKTRATLAERGIVCRKPRVAAQGDLLRDTTGARRTPPQKKWGATP